jgi:4-alpha-glucanotransferase
MQLVFRVNYHTEPGQSLWLKLVAFFTGSGARIEQGVALRWLNDRQWEAVVELQGLGPLRLSYNYQLRQAGNGVKLDEWLAPRVVEVDPAARDTLVVLDTWRCAGTPDYALETHALTVLLPARGPFMQPIATPEADHEFLLHMAAVPPGCAPCLLGNVRELGTWNWQLAQPLAEVAANVWRLALRLAPDWHVEYKYGLYDLTKSCMTAIEQGGNRVLAGHACGPRQWTRVSDEGYARSPMEKFRGCGVAVPVFSLRSAAGLGVGEFADLKTLADWAQATGLRLIQVLPVNDTTAAHDWTDSYPYSGISGFALHPLYLRLDDLSYPLPPALATQLTAARQRLNPLPDVDYEAVTEMKRRLTREIYQHHQAAVLTDDGIHKFLKVNRDWLLPYAVFCLLRDVHHTADFSRWGEWATCDRTRVDGLLDKAGPQWPDIFYHVWLQYELDRQLLDAARHLHDRGIALKGDLPIGVDRHSVDAWWQPHLFNLTAQAGAPPDAFALKGQNWGFPTYNWAAMQADGYAWWRARFAQLSRYFDAYRIDHILGFFRIWQIPHDQVEGIMGWFEPAIPVTLDELHARGICFDINRFCRPYIREHSLVERFGEQAGLVKDTYLEPCGYDYWKLREEVATQRRIVEVFHALTAVGSPQRDRDADIRDALLDCASEVLLLEAPNSNGSLFHPRCMLQTTRSYQELDEDVKWRLDDLYHDYFHRRQESFWQACGYEKLPLLRAASPMLLCGEDLGMVPDCVPGVLAELGILSLEIQRMPKKPQTDFAHTADAPYMSVVSPSTHDMPTLRGWWREDPDLTGHFASSMLGMEGPAPELSGETACRILVLHLHSPAMWAVFPLQDLLAIDESLHHPDPEAERINVPAIMPHYWRYRMHLDLAQLAAAAAFNQRLLGLIKAAGR